MSGEAFGRTECGRWLEKTFVSQARRRLRRTAEEGVVYVEKQAHGISTEAGAVRAVFPRDKHGSSTPAFSHGGATNSF
eukprot:scaffold1642_cov252-Pinguiococcus_pyrenoidosus.AAC.9